MVKQKHNQAPGLGERYARLGYGAQDRLAASLILDALQSSGFRSVRLADLEGGKADDFVLVWERNICGNSVKWTSTQAPLTWADLCGASDPLIPQLVDGWTALRIRWPEKTVRVYLRTNRVASSTIRSNQLVPNYSLEMFLTETWEAVRRSDTSIDTQGNPAWKLLQECSGLDERLFCEFVASCFIVTSVQSPNHPYPESLDAEQWQREFNLLRQAINDWVEKNPTQDEFTAEDIRRAIGTNAYHLRWNHRFPEPEIGYEENERAVYSLRNAVSNHDQGYLFLLGPAGAGKSTLAQKVIEDELFGIPYFAYLPAGQGDVRTRGEGLTFYKYLITILDQWESVRKAHGVSDLAQAKEALTRHMERIRDRYRATGRKTIILIDGVDHITREEGLDHPLYRELPLPEELPEGCLILISTQPQALNQLRPPLQYQAKDSSRVINVVPLNTDAIYRCLSSARIGRSLSPEEKADICRLCGGNPLILTFIIKAIRSALEVSLHKIIDQIGIFAGDIEKYYFERFRQLLDEPNIKRLLGLLCRIRGRAQLTWLQTWPEWEEFERLHRFHVDAFLQFDDGWVNFAHNSLISFLVRQTQSDLPGCDYKIIEKKYYDELAARCPKGSCAQQLARDRLYYQVMADNHNEVLDTATIEWFREGAEAFVPFNELLSLISMCYRSCVAKDKRGALLCLLASAKEIEQRSSTIEGHILAQHFLDLDQPDRALEHIINGSQLLIQQHEALIFCIDLARYSEESGNERLMRKAWNIFDLAKPAHLMFTGEPIDTHRSHDYQNILAAWTVASVYFLPIDQTLQIINNLEFNGLNERLDETAGDIRAFLLYKLLDSLLASKRESDCKIVIAAIDQIGESEWALYARIRLIEYRQDQGDVSLEELDELRKIVDFRSLPEDARLLLARYLFRAGLSDEASDLVATLKLPKVVPSPERRNYGLTDIVYRITLARLRSSLALPSLSIEEDWKRDAESAARVAVACAEVGELLGIADRGEPTPHGLRERFKHLFSFHLRRLRFQPSQHFHHYASAARTKVYDAMLDTAKLFGASGRKALRDAFFDIINTPRQGVLDAFNRRRLAISLWQVGAISAAEALDIIRQSTGGSTDTDTSERTEICFNIAQDLHSLGDKQSACEWVVKAGHAAHGIGYHKDYQMITWIEWLNRSFGVEKDEATRPEIQLAARVLEVAGGDGGTDAAQNLVQISFRCNPIVGVKLGLEMIERDRISLAECLEAVIEAGAYRGADPNLLAAIYDRVYTLIEVRPSGKLGKAIVGGCGNNEQAGRVAAICIQAVYVNCPPDYRRTAVRGVYDSLRKRGIDVPNRVRDLPPDQEDKVSSSWLYKLSDGNVRSLTEVAYVLSKPDCEADWNPNPEENEYFAWSEALEKVSIKSSKHLDRIEQCFVTGKRREPAILAVLSRTAMQIRDFAIAERLAVRAREQARNGSWIKWLDGGIKREVYRALIEVNQEYWLPIARSDFNNDLLAGRISNFFLLSEITAIFDVLRYEWPNQEALKALTVYIEGMTKGIELPPVYESLTPGQELRSPDEALCWLLVQLYSHPVIAVAANARVASIDYLLKGGKGLLWAFATISQDDTIALERALIVLHAVCIKDKQAVVPFMDFILSAENSLSVAVRAIVRRICEILKWSLPSTSITELPTLYTLALPEEDGEYRALLHQGAEEIPGRSLGITIEMYGWILEHAAQVSSLPFINLSTRARQIYSLIESTHSWSRDKEAKVNHWKNAVPVRSYLRPRALVGRETVMRILNELVCAGRLGDDIFRAYDDIVPIYDPHLESEHPNERPEEIKGITVEDHFTDWKSWVGSI
ncbi:MAG TPA: ATP-binding protein [Chthonomonadaceae bacterium]|nr:ATP-binding protein [Chthonomonadaceae bacterium]